MKKVRTLIRSSPVIIAMIYVVVGSLWILFSDQWVFTLMDDPEAITRAQSQKGWFFVIASGVLIFFLIRTSNHMLGQVIHDLDKASKKFRSTLEYAPVGIAHHHPDGYWLEVNQTLCRMLGYSREELMQLHFSDFIHPADVGKGHELDRNLSEGIIDHYAVEKRYVRKDGSEFYGLIRKSAVFDNHGNVQYLIAVLEDITPQKEHEKNIRKSLREKEILLSEIHHRVKNNLALISALFELQNMYVEDEYVRSILDKSNIRIKSLSVVHDNFSESGSASQIDFGKCLEKLSVFFRLALFKNDEESPIDTDIDSVRLNINLAIPVALIFTELMLYIRNKQMRSQEKKDVEVSLKEDNEEVKLSLRYSEKDAEHKTYREEDPDHLTFLIVDTLVKQVEGDFATDVRQDQFVYELIFPRKEIKGGGSSLTDAEDSSAS